MNNKKLIIVFAALLGLYLLSRLIFSDRERTFDPQIVQLDTATVSEIRLFPKAEDGNQITLSKSEKGWTASQGDKSFYTPYNKVSNILSQLSSIRSERIVSKAKEKWPEYEVDEQGSRVEVFAKDKKVADFVVGTFKFDQATRTASSYLRPSDEDDVHLVDGFITMSFNQQFDAFRNSQLVKLNREDVLKITQTMGGEAYAISKNPADGLWYLGGMEQLDSTTAAQYIGQITNVFGSEFADGEPAGEPVRVLEIMANNLVSPVILSCYSVVDTSRPFVVHSSANPENWFASDSAGLYTRLFGKFDDLLKTE